MSLLFWPIARANFLGPYSAIRILGIRVSEGPTGFVGIWDSAFGIPTISLRYFIPKQWRFYVNEVPTVFVWIGGILVSEGIPISIRVSVVFFLGFVVIGIHISEGIVLRVVGIGIHISEGMLIGIQEWSGVVVLGGLGIRIGIRVIGVFWKTAKVFFLVISDSIFHHGISYSGFFSIHFSEGIPIPIRVSGGPDVFVLGVC